MREFDLIRRLSGIFESAAAGLEQPPCELGIGDDAAVLEVPAGRRLVACTDSLVEGVHFPPDTDPAAIGHKALAVNLSDLAAMGADPAWFLLSLTLPRSDRAWLEAFGRGMADLAAEAGITLAGGDTTSGPLAVCVTALGWIPPGRALTRGGARPGDRVVVSGRPGAAAHALRALQAGSVPEVDDRHALDKPTARLALGRALRGCATACIDLSDGLLADLGHVLQASGVGADIEAGRLACPGSLARLPEDQRLPLQLAGGDDYELCFTLPADRAGEIPALAAAGGVELSDIGEISAQPGLRVRCTDGSPYRGGAPGWEHFDGEGQA